MRIRLDEIIKVRLTDYGKDVYYHRWDELNRRCGREVVKPTYPETDEDGYTSFLLLDFINFYGNPVGLWHLDEVISPSEIVYDERGDA